MQAQIYPTAPADMAQHEAGLPPPSSYSEGEQHLESPGKAKAVLSMVKLHARKLKDKIKKVTNTSSSKDATDHDDLHQPAHEEEEEEAGADLYEDGEEEDDHINQEDNQVKYERLRSFGVLDKQRDGSEVEVHGGVPVSAVAADPGTYCKAENEVAPISPYESAGPPDALQATPTYRNYGLNDGSTDPQVEVHGGVPVSAVAADPGTYWKAENEVAPISPYKSAGPPDALHATPTAYRNYILNDGSTDPQVEVHGGVPVSAVAADPGTYLRTENEDAHISPYKSDGPPDAWQATLTDDHNYDLGDGSTGPHPSFGGLSDDVQVERSSHVAAYPSQVNDPRGKNLEPDSLSFPTFAEEKTSLLSDSAAADQPCSDRELGSHGNSASSDMHVGYPEDLVKPNPDFGLPSSPISDKIGVLNEDPSTDNNNNTPSGGPLTEEWVRDWGKENLLKTAVPEFNELRENQALNTAPVSAEVDELVHRPVSDTTAVEADGSSYTTPPAELDGVVYRAVKNTKDTVASSDEQADDGHISPYKSDGPPDARQATLTDDHNYDLGDGSTGPHPSFGGLSDDVQVERSSHVAAYPSQVNDPRGKNLEPDSLSFPTFAEEKTSLLSDSAAADQPCSDRELGSHGNSASSDMHVDYPEDLVKPNPDFGLPSSPISDKIGVLNEDPSTDNNNNTPSGGPLTEEWVRDWGKENLLKTAVPEFNELRENQALNTAPVAAEVDELVHRPVSDTTAVEADGSSYTTPPAELDGVVYRAVKNTKDTVASSDEHADDGVGAVDADRKITSVVEDNGVAGSAPGGNLAYTNDDYSIVDKSNEIPREEGNNESLGRWTTEQLNNAKDTILTMKVGLSGENLPSEQSPLIERECNQESLNESWGKWTSDKLNNAENSVTENVGLGGENLSSKPPSLNEDVGVENEDVGAADKSNQEGCGKWSADKLNNAKDYVTTMAGLGDTDVAEQPSINGNAEAHYSSTQQWGKWSADKLNNAMDVVATKVGVSGGNSSVEKPADHENVEELAATRRPGKVGNDADEEYYEPNMVKNNAFREGFSLGNEDAEEEALNASLAANSAPGKLQGLKDTVASSLGYGNASSGEHPHDDSTGFAGASEVGPATDAGCFAETGSKVDSEDMGLPPNQQQTGGPLQDLKTAVAAQLGYGPSEELPADMKAAKEEPKHEAEARTAYVDDERAGKDGDHQSSSYAQKLFNTTAAARDYLATKVGYGNDKNVASRLVQEEEGDGKPIISSSAYVDQLEESDDNNINSKPSIASSWLSPAEEDKALSQLITEKMSNTVAVLKQKLVSPRTKPTPTALAPQEDA